MLDAARHQPRPIVVGSNGSARSHAAVVRASILAYSRGARLHVVTVHSAADSVEYRRNRTVAPRDIAYTLTPRQEAAATVDHAIAIARGLGVEAIGHTAQGSVAQTLAHIVRATCAEAVVIGATAKRSRLAELLSPSTGRALVAANLCPVIIVDTAHGPALRLVSVGRRIVEVHAVDEPLARRAS